MYRGWLGTQRVLLGRIWFQKLVIMNMQYELSKLAGPILPRPRGLNLMLPASNESREPCRFIHFEARPCKYQRRRSRCEKRVMT